MTRQIELARPGQWDRNETETWAERSVFREERKKTKGEKSKESHIGGGYLGNFCIEILPSPQEKEQANTNETPETTNAPETSGTPNPPPVTTRRIR